MDLAERITATLTPHLGAYTADVVARHLCTKYEIGPGAPDPAKLAHLQDFLRRGLVAYVGAERAQSLADECLKSVSG